MYLYIPAINKQISGCSERPSVGREIAYGALSLTYPLLKSGLAAERSGSKCKTSGAVSGSPVNGAER